MTDTTMHELAKGFGALLSRSKVRRDCCKLRLDTSVGLADLTFSVFDRRLLPFQKKRLV
jgi:hypothetical protein